eukprot:scaffold40047_cov63-Phaeocystis_antarctica.AAC.4
MERYDNQLSISISSVRTDETPERTLSARRGGPPQLRRRSGGGAAAALGCDTKLGSLLRRLFTLRQLALGWSPIPSEPRMVGPGWSGLGGCGGSPSRESVRWMGGGCPSACWRTMCWLCWLCWPGMPAGLD